MTDIEKKQLLTLWDKLGVSYDHTRYLGSSVKFFTYYDYLETVAEYYGIRFNSFVGATEVYKDMVEYFNEKVKEHLTCDNEIVCVEITPNFNVQSPSAMKNIYDGHGGINGIKIYATVDEKYEECPEDYEEEVFYDLQCHDDRCVTKSASLAMRDVKNKYGVRLGSVSFETKKEI